jgi:diacylglycerol kinase family enzyme
MRHAYIIYNPHAGRFPSPILVERAAAVLRNCGWMIDVIKTRSGSHITELSQEAVDREMDAIFIVGGDEINLALSALINTNTALGCAAIRTSNVFAQVLACLD